MRTVLCDRLGSRFPVVQTAMGWVADAKLVAATGNAGGFGFLAGATIEPELLEGEILRVKSLTEAPFGVNFHMFQPNAAEVIELVIKHRIRAVSYGRGPDAKTVRRLKDAGVVCMPTVGALKHAVKAVELGADVITVQGGEGGGHTGSVPTTVLLPQVLDAVKIPVVAAGGFADGRGLAAALAFGAAGIAMGTRFLLTVESPVPDAVKQRYLATREAGDIRASRAVDGMPQRMIENAQLLRVERMGALQRLATGMSHGLSWGRRTGMSYAQMAKLAVRGALDPEGGFAETVMAANAPTMIRRAIVDGDPDNGLLPSGQVAAAIDRLETVADLIQRIVRDAEARLDALKILERNT
jgi:NAD(P)H-dependent flavin oxidoreductase YrpB (nitropropane dioxygenase family)